MKLAVGARTDVGRVRGHNEDAYLARDPLFAVADGLGGHRGGEVASRVALETLGEVAAGELEEDGIPTRLIEGVARANEAVMRIAADDPGLSGMGTTLTVAVAGAGRLYIAHVGDSRAYLLREGGLRALTEDHTLVRRMVREGRLTPEEADVHPQRSILTRALGIDQDLEIDQATVETMRGDRLLLCSDGLTSMVHEEEIQAILVERRDPQTASDALVEAANTAGGQDNITAVVLDILETEHPPAAIPADARVRASDVAPGAAAPPASPVRRRRGVRLALTIAVPLAVLGSLLGIGRAYVDRQWFVGVHDGSVALFRGIPVRVLGFDLSRVVERTPVPADSAMRLQPWMELDQGITASSEDAARDIIAQIQADVSETPASPPPGTG